MPDNVIALVLAGGEGARLFPLTRDRAKPAVPFGGRYRIIDFVLSNMVNSGVMQIFVLTQCKSQSLTEHLMSTWSFSSVLKKQFVFPVPVQMRTGRSWYGGTADAVFQNLHLLQDYEPREIAVFGADHIYKMDVSQMLGFHREKQACATVAAIPVPLADASEYGVLQIDDQWRVVGFEEKPAKPTPMPGCADTALVSMGNYIFDRGCLGHALERDAGEPASTHDFGRDILPGLADGGRLFAYNFHTNKVPGLRNGHNVYWRDISSIARYYEANMDLRGLHPELNLYTPHWPIRSRETFLPPARFMYNEQVGACGLPRIGHAINSFVSEGSVINGAVVDGSVLGPSVHAHHDATVVNSVLLEGVVVGAGARVRNAIIDKHVRIPKDDTVGYDHAADERRGYTVVPHGHGNWITVIPKETRPEIEDDGENSE